MATAVNLQTMSSSMPFDFLPMHSHTHSRANSLSSASTSSSRPHSSQGIPAAADLYASPYLLHHPPSNHNLANPALKNHLRHTHMRARVAASPYPRDTDSVHSSSSETEDMAMFLGNAAPAAGPADYHLFAAPPHHTIAQTSQEAAGIHNAVGRMSIHEQTLEKLAGNVRAATSTSASDRAKQIFVQAWLSANYVQYPEGNVPRQGLYFSYRRICDQYGIPHINTATLGKAIRLCFPNIKTRRLGVRGNSKYHYCGIRPSNPAEAEWLQDYVNKSNNNAGQQSINAARMASEAGDGQQMEKLSDEDEDDESENGGTSSVAGGTASKRSSLALSGELKAAGGYAPDLSDKTPTAATLLAQAQSAQRPAGSYPPQASIRRHSAAEGALSMGGAPGAPAPSTSAQPHPAGPAYLTSSQPVSVRQFPNFPTIDEAVGPGPSPHGFAAREVWGWFQDHLDALLESVRLFRFDQFEMHLRTFWSNLAGHHREVVHAPAIAGLMAKADAMVYDEILEILRLQMLSPIPASSLTNLRQFANKMEKILLVALDGYGNTFVEPKVELGARFGHLVLRFLDIYQVTQALTTVLTNQKQLAEMRRSWQKVDFESVRNQSALVCNCRHEDLVQLLEVEFVALMESLTKTTEPVREVMAWADKCCERLMGSSRVGLNGVEERGTMSSRSILIRWGYVTSQVMRDLTIRSDPAFGAFQILKLFLDDWISVNVLRSVALSTNSVAASVEPVMQQNFLSLSPMAGQENFGHAAQMMAHTPTTSSMLAALQNDPFPGGAGSLDPTSSAFNTDFSSLAYMDTSPTSASQENASGGLAFADFAGSGAFDVPGFNPQELSIHASPAAGTPGSDPEQHHHSAHPSPSPDSGVKSEGEAV